jgi:glycosyltransferase involved in cell wall biosynthesis
LRRKLDSNKYKLWRKKSMNVLVLTRLPIIDASSRQRVYQFKEILKNDYGIHITISPFYPNDDFIKYRNGELGIISLTKYFVRRIKEISRYKKYDLIWVLRSVAPIEMPWVLKIIKKMEVPILFEFDDAIYLGEKATRLRTKLTRSWDKVHKYVEIADGIIVGNEILGEWAREYNKNVFVIPTGVNVDDYPIKTNFTSNKTFTIGWIGSASTAQNLEVVLPALKELSNIIKIKFVVLGGVPMSIDTENIEYHDVSWSLENQAKFLKEFDVGIAPLYDTPFNNGKCAYKIIQYMATGIPVIASPVGVQTDIINHYNNGFLANDTNEWVQAFLTLANSIDLRKKMGANSRIAAEKDYDITILASRIAETIKNVYSNKSGGSHENIRNCSF